MARPKSNAPAAPASEPDVPDLDLDVLAGLSDEDAEAALAAVEEVKAERAQNTKIAELSKALASLTIEELHALLQKNPALGAIFGAQLDKQAQQQLKQAGPLPPGSIVGTGLQQIKVPWSEAKIRELYGTVTFVPSESRDVIVNGVRYRLKANEPNEVPSIVQDIYTQSLKARADADRWANWYFNQGGGGFHGSWTPGFDAPPQPEGEPA